MRPWAELDVVLPSDIDPDAVKAALENGVLTVTAPKPAEARAQSRRVPIG